MSTKKQHSTDTEDPTLAGMVGGGFALLQHGIDKAIEWGFSAMKNVHQSTDPDNDIAHPHLRRAAKFGRGVIGFMGDAGQAYYRSYERLKRRETSGSSD